MNIKTKCGEIKVIEDENGYTKRFMSMCKEQLEKYRNRLLSLSDNTKSIG